MLASNTPNTPAEVATLRKAGISSFVTIGNQVYMGPGMGITSASTPTRVSMTIFKIRKYIKALVEIVYDPTNQFKTESAASGIFAPEYSISLTKRGLAVYEKYENKAFVFPRVTHLEGNNFLAELHDLIAPEWAVDFVAC